MYYNFILESVHEFLHVQILGVCKNSQRYFGKLQAESIPENRFFAGNFCTHLIQQKVRSNVFIFELKSGP